MRNLPAVPSHPSPHPSESPSSPSNNPPTTFPSNHPPSSTSSFSILPAQRADISALIDVLLAASYENLLQHFFTPTPQLLEETRQHAIEEWEGIFGRPNLIALKAVSSSGEIRGMGVWIKKGWESLSEEGNEDNKDLLFTPLFPPPSPSPRPNSKPPDKRKALQTHINQNFATFLTSWTSPTKNLYLAALFTHPSSQGRGIGSALLEYGHDIADREGIPCFLIGTPVGHPFYKWKGWMEVGEFDVDLREWDEMEDKWGRGDRGERGWGVYRYWYMCRMARTAGRG